MHLTQANPTRVGWSEESFTHSESRVHELVQYRKPPDRMRRNDFVASLSDSIPKWGPGRL